MTSLSILKQALLAALFFAALAYIIVRPAFGQANSASDSARPYPINHFLWSRHARQDADGYYYQPVGLCDDYPVSARSQANLDKDFVLMRAAGAKMFRVGISWRDIEYERGRYDWSFWDRLVDTAVRNHVQLIPYVCYAPSWAAPAYDLAPYDPKDFQDFMQAIAGRYKGKVHSWELWNEPDNPGFWQGGIRHYAELVKAGAKGVRAADPQAAVVLGGVSGDAHFLADLCSRYQIQNYVDVINFHAYFETWSDNRLEYMTSYVEQMADATGGTGSPLDLWLAEFGYSDLPPGRGSGVYDFAYQHTREYQAVAFFRMQVLALSTGRISLTAWYRINDLPPGIGVIGDDNNRYLGIVDVDGHEKPIFYALRFYNTLFGKPVRCIDRLVTITRPSDSQSEAHVFQLRDGTLIVVAWLRSALPGELPARDGMDTRREEIAITLPAGAGKRIRIYDETGRSIKPPAVLAGRQLEHVVLTGPGIFIAQIAP